MESPITDFQLLPAFLLEMFVERMSVHLNRSATLSEVLKKVEILSNGSPIKFELDQTFA